MLPPARWGYIMASAEPREVVQLPSWGIPQRNVMIEQLVHTDATVSECHALERCGCKYQEPGLAQRRQIRTRSSYAVIWYLMYRALSICIGCRALAILEAGFGTRFHHFSRLRPWFIFQVAQAMILGFVTANHPDAVIIYGVGDAVHHATRVTWTDAAWAMSGRDGQEYLSRRAGSVRLSAGSQSIILLL